jgi:hypothetical protein
VDNNTIILQTSLSSTTSQPTVIVQAPPLSNSAGNGNSSVISRVYGTEAANAYKVSVPAVAMKRPAPDSAVMTIGSHTTGDETGPTMVAVSAADDVDSSSLSLKRIRVANDGQDDEEYESSRMSS